MLSVGIAFLLEYLDNTVKSEQDIEKLLGLPVLGAISEIDQNEERKAVNKGNHIKGSHERGGEIEA